MEEVTVVPSYPMSLPRDVWVYLSDFLDLKDIGRLAQTCSALHILFTKNAKLLDKWFRELKAQCRDETGNEGRELLSYCQSNIRNTPALLSVLDKLLHQPNPADPIPALEDPVAQTIDALTRRVYADPKNNPRDTLRRALMSIIENNDHLIARSAVIVQRDKIFDQRFDRLPYIAFG